MAGELFGRTYKLIVAPVAGTSLSDAIAQAVSGKNPPNAESTGLDLQGLDIKFHVRRTLKAKPNTCKIEVFGLNASSRQYLSMPKKLAVSLEAGYNDENELLFLGETRNTFSRQEPNGDWMTFIETGDSEKAMAAAGLRQTFGAGSLTVNDAFKALQAQIPGIITPSWLETFKELGGKVFFSVGGAISRNSVRFLDDVCRSAELQWSIQNGILCILKIGDSLTNHEILLSPDTGLIGSPSADRDGIHVDVYAFIVPGLRPGALINVQSQDYKGNVVIETIDYHGETAAGAKQWYAKMVCTRKTT